jgi:hypothetical protein
MITFADKPEEVADFTSSVEDIQGRLVYTVPKGRTALLDAIYLGVSKMRQAKYTKKALLIISDGGDNNSRYTSTQISDLVREADVQVYAMGVFEPTLSFGLSAGTGGARLGCCRPSRTRPGAGRWQRQICAISLGLPSALESNSAISTCWRIRPKTPAVTGSIERSR